LILRGLKASVHNYAIENTGDYTVGKIDDNVSLKEAEKTVLNKIVADNVTKVYYKIKKAGDKIEEREFTIIPRPSDISIRKTFLTYVPKWSDRLKGLEILNNMFYLSVLLVYNLLRRPAYPPGRPAALILYFFMKGFKN